MRNFLLNTLTRHVGTQPHPILQLNGVACLMMRKRNPIGCSSASRDDNAVAISLQTPSRDPSESHRTTRTRQEESNQEEPDDAASLTNHKVIVRRQPASTHRFGTAPLPPGPHRPSHHHLRPRPEDHRPPCRALNPSLFHITQLDPKNLDNPHYNLDISDFNNS